VAAEDRPRRVDIGFSGGQILTLRMQGEPYDALLRALREARGEEPWHLVHTEDSDVTLDLRQVVYVRLDTEQHKVGF
jgi:hypothetical protein